MEGALWFILCFLNSAKYVCLQLKSRTENCCFGNHLVHFGAFNAALQLANKEAWLFSGAAKAPVLFGGSSSEYQGGCQTTTGVQCEIAPREVVELYAF